MGVSKRRNLTIFSASKIYEDKGAKLLAISFCGVRSVYAYRCSCGNIHEKSMAAFEKNPKCPKCRVRKRTPKLTLEEVKKEFSDAGLIFLDGDYRGVDKRHLCRCSCGRESYRTLSNVRAGKKCADCSYKFAEGEDNPKWNPYLTDEERVGGRYSSDYYKWRKEVLRRDGFYCQHCGEEGSSLNVHHIVPYSVDTSKRVEPTNGVTLCEICHKEIHKDIPLEDMDESSFSEYSQRDSFSPELEIDFDYETGEVCYSTIIS